jgi:translation initiation factor 1
MAQKPDKRPEVVAPLKHNPFAALRAEAAPSGPTHSAPTRDTTKAPSPPGASAAAPAPEPATSARAATTSAPAATPPAAGKGPARAVVRMERKGRGGKEVTIIDKLELAPAAREQWLKALKQSLGTGGVLEGEDLVLQGDHRDRAAAWLEARGVRKVTVAR